MADLTTVAAVKAYAGIAGSEDDGPIGTIVAGVSTLLHGLVGHDYEGEVITGENHTAPFSGAIVLRKPAQAIDEIRERKSTLAASAYELIDERLVWRLNLGDTVGWTNDGARSIEVDYTTTDQVPKDLELAAREVAAFMVKQSGLSAGGSRMGLSAQSNADAGTADYFAQALAQLPFVQLVLRRFKRYA